KIAFMKEYQMKPSSAKLDIPSDEYQINIEDFIRK
ncbi:hypothetical protein MEC_00065, partial [Bartonella alsatica IBS 382]